MMEKLIITAAICGAEVAKENSPAVPYTVERWYERPRARMMRARRSFMCMSVGTTAPPPRTGNGSA